MTAAMFSAAAEVQMQYKAKLLCSLGDDAEPESLG